MKTRPEENGQSKIRAVRQTGNLARAARRNTGRNRGGTLVESALVLSVFLLFTFGIMDFGRLLYAYNFCSFAARDATRYASVRGSTSGSPATSSTIQTFVTGLAVGLTSSSLTVTTSWSPDNTPGSTVTVKVAYAYAPMVKMILASTLNVASQSKATIMQ
jgi:Flp pilus assembly protein TadG